MNLRRKKWQKPTTSKKVLATFLPYEKFLFLTYVASHRLNSNRKYTTV
jgi:hypothetical protein